MSSVPKRLVLLVTTCAVYCPATAVQKLSSLLNGLRNHFFSFDGLLVNDLAMFRTHAQSKLRLFICQFMMAYLCLNYLLMPSHQGVAMRLLFTFSLLYTCVRFPFVPSSVMSKCWMLVDFVLGQGLNLYMNHEDQVSGALITVCIVVGFSLFVTNLPFNLAFAFLIALINSCCAGVAQPNFAQQTLRHAVLYCLVVWLIQIYNVLLDGYSHKYIQASKKAEVQIQSKSLFFASASHDLKNPLNSMLACMDMLVTSEQINGSDKKTLRTAMYSGQILQNLIGNILDITKIETGSFDVDRIPLSIEDEIKKILRIESQLALKKGIALYKRNLTHMPRRVFGDPMRFAQIIMNIVGNSIKFTSRGYVAIVLRWVRSVEEIKDSAGNSSQDVCESLIPPEGFFKQDSKAFCDTRGKLRIDGMLHRKSHTLDVDEDVDVSGVNEGVEDEPIVQKMSRYCCSSDSSRGSRFTESEAGEGDRSNPRRAKDAVKSLFAEDRKKSSRGFLEDGGGLLEPVPLKEEVASAGLPSMERCKRPMSEALLNRQSSYSIKHVEPEIEFGDSGILVMEVIDTGEGMKEEEQNRLFKPFTQANGSIRGRFGGTGLGLWITKQLVQRMSGLIDVRSQFKRGSRFTITLPLKVVREEVSPLESNNGEVFESAALRAKENICTLDDLRARPRVQLNKGNSLLKGMRIMVVENERSMEDGLMQQVLEQLRGTYCELVYATYSTALKTLKDNEYKFDSLIVVSTTHTVATKKLATIILKTMKDSSGTSPVPLMIAFGICQAVT